MNTLLAAASARLAVRADHLRSLHEAGNPLVLVNVWDAASARRVESAGARALATSSRAIAESLGVPDDNTMGPELAFDAVRRIATAASVPVTADLEAGYGLAAEELVDGLLAAGAVGCNLEDSDHTRPGELVGADLAAERLAAVRSTGSETGVDIVLNARIDVLLTDLARDPHAAFDEMLHRAHLYAAAGADCVYPIGLTDPDVATRLVRALPVAVNANLAPSTTVADLAAVGVKRISVGPVAHAVAMDALSRRAGELLG